MLESDNDFSILNASDIMSAVPKTINIDVLVYDALQVMETNNISQLIVMDNTKYVGMIHIHEILKSGVV